MTQDLHSLVSKVFWVIAELEKYSNKVEMPYGLARALAALESEASQNPLVQSVRQGESLPRNIDELWERKVSSLTPDQRREIGLRVLRDLQGSFKGDSRSAIDALELLDKLEGQ